MATTLFNDIPDFRKAYPNYQNAGKADDLFPYLEMAARDYLHPYIGESYYNDLRDALETATYDLTTLTAPRQAIATILRRAEAFFGLHTALPFLGPQTGSMGSKLHQLESTMEPKMWQTRDLQAMAMRQADLALDQVLKVMEATPDDYTIWRDSTAFTVHHQYLITRADEFTFIQGSRRTYMALLPALAIIEERHIIPSIGTDLLAAFKTKQKTAATFTTHEQTVVDFLKKAISYLTLSHGAPDLKMDISSQGVRVVSHDDGITGIKGDSKEFLAWINQKQSDGLFWLGKAKAYLDANESQFTDYEDSKASDREHPQYGPTVIGSGGSIMV